MEVADAEAKTSRRLEPAAGGMHTDCWWRKRVVRGEHQRAPVLTAFVGCIWRAGEDIVPPGTKSARQWTSAAADRTQEYLILKGEQRCMEGETSEYSDIPS